MAALYPGELGFLRCGPLLSWCLDCIREDIDVPSPTSHSRAYNISTWYHSLCVG